MQQLLSQLNKDSQEQFIRMRNSINGVDSATFQLSLEYFFKYCEKVGQVSDKLPIVMRATLFIAQKSQNIQTVKGQKIVQPSVTLGPFIRMFEPDTFMLILKDILSHVEIKDQFASKQVKDLIREMSFMLTFHKKFQKCIQKLQLKERHPQTSSGQYLKHWTSFAWLLYIEVKSKAFQKDLDLIECTCLLAHVISFMVSFSWDYLVPKAILRQQKKINENSSIKEVILIFRSKLMQMCCIKYQNIYENVAGRFEGYFQDELLYKSSKEKGFIKVTKQNSSFVSPQLIHSNFNKLDKFYEKNKDPRDLDLRIFFRERLTNLTPSKFTPFARQGYTNKGRRSTQNQATNYSSHRILTYQMQQKIQTTMKNNNQAAVNMKLPQLPRGVIISPSPSMKVQLIHQTPISAANNMFSYIQDQARKAKQLFGPNTQQRAFQPQIYKYIQRLMQIQKKKTDKKTKEIKQNLTYSLFKFALEQFLAQHPKEANNQDLYLALMVISVEIVFFVNNSTFTFQDIEKQVNVQAFDMWKACDFFANFDRNMPMQLKGHLIDLEAGYLCYKLWQNRQNLRMVSKAAKNQVEQRYELSDRLLRKVLIQTAFQINHLSSQLGLQQRITQYTFSTIKQIFTSHIQLLQLIHLDQLIMCTIFAFNKVQKLQLSFRQIIQKYRQISLYNKNMHDDLINKITVKGRDDEMNLINYYNQVFIKVLKDSIIALKNSSGNSHNHGNCQQKRNSQNPLLYSPLKDVLPRQLNKKNVKKNSKDNINLLIAHSQSPMLRHEPRVLKAPINSKIKKIINLDEQEKRDFKGDKNSEREHEKLSPNEVSNHNYAQYNKKGNNMPYKTHVNGLTPTRINKTVSAHINTNNFQLSQFSSNTQAPITSHRVSSQLHQQNQNRPLNFGTKGTRMHYQ